MPLFVTAIFLSAFLLFQVQPVIARYILPWYGGSPGVWTTCLLFFQVGLLGGYAYTHGLVSGLREKRGWQVGIHLGLLGLAMILLPITPSDDLKPTGGDDDPIWGIVRLLASTVGFPYLLISASGPLLQHWFAEAYPTRSPYRLYAISNIGSMLGLLTYPFLFEPMLTVAKQTQVWSIGFAVYGLFAVGCGYAFLKHREKSDAFSTEAEDKIDTTPLLDKLLWVVFPACGSMLLLALTNQMCQDVAVVPFLWVLPLSLYLLTFVIAFDHARWYFRPVALPLAVLAIAAVVKLILSSFSEEEMHINRQIAIYCSAIFFGCMACHGEAVRIKPASRFLTKFYLSISLGGALGGLFVSLIAPQLFTGYFELHLAFLLFAGLITLQLFRRFGSGKPRACNYAAGFGWLALVVVLALSLSLHLSSRKDGEIGASRGFYGVLQVYEFGDGTKDHFRELYHGRIAHGRQYMNEELQTLATSYFSWESAVGGIFSCHPSINRESPKPMHVGVIGLGIGTISSYAREGDRYRFYEINPQVEDMARKYFTFLTDCKGEESVIIGDGRVSLEWELAADNAQNFDVLFVDAFSGDSIPIHLLTKEAFELYFQHLKPDGVLAIHITNLHLDLSDPVRNIAADFGYEVVRVEGYPEIGTRNIYYSDWVLISRNETFLQSLTLNQYPTEWDRETPKDIHWRDDYSNLLEVIMEE
jgi:hypothetical protein